MKNRLCSTSLLNGQGIKFNLKLVLRVLLPTIVGGSGLWANAQDITVDKVYHPDEPIHVIVTFASRVDLSSVVTA